MINTGQIAQLLRPGLKAVFGQYPTYPEQWTEIFKTYQSDKYQEIEVEMKYLGAADIKPEGAPIATDSMGQRIVTNYIHKRVGLSFTITKEAVEDNLYQSQFPQQAVSLRNSLRVTKNILGANVLNNAFNAAYPIGDGQPVCSDNHPIDGGVFSNAFAGAAPNVDFSEAGVEQAIILIQKFPMQSGILSQTMAKKLILPRELQFAASRLLNSAFRVDVANNDINALYHNDYIPDGYKINQYLTSPTAWFIITDAEDGLKHFQRTPVDTDTYVDFATDNVMAKATERYSFGVSNSRGIFGSPGV
ncbi:MAG TPA: hypothetical protein VMV86_01595 [Methanosarcinales archaeon]|nr:hypothetical protein [Methanosarcinales archaeon]